LQDNLRAQEFWPEEIAKNPSFQGQLEAHRQVNQCLDEVIGCLPGPTVRLEAAVKSGHITEAQTGNLYNRLGDLLEDGDYARLALYLPFEFMPDKSWLPASAELSQAAERFKDVYMEAWRSLLGTHDVRANFVDGDVLEVEQRTSDLPRVVKAAHLIPKLVEAGMLEIDEVINLLETSDDQILKDSIIDTAPMLWDLGLIGKDQVASMQASEYESIQELALAITLANPATKSEHIVLSGITFTEILESLGTASAGLGMDETGGLTEKRKAWLKYAKAMEQVEILAGGVSHSIALDNLSEDTINGILSSEDNSLPAQVLIEGIQKAIEAVGTDDLEKGAQLYEKYRSVLEHLWGREDPGIQQALVKSARHLYRLGMVDGRQLAEAGVALPTLVGELSENLALIPDEIDRIKELAGAVESSPELSSLIYPVFLVYGSRLKGYGDGGVDIDLGVFVKPDTPHTERPRLRQLLQKTLSNGEKADAVIEFWLDEADKQLQIHDFLDLDVLRGESHWTHVLFGAAWAGDKNIVNELRRKILPAYFYETDDLIYGHRARQLWLEEIERDALQYRLLHKGYERHYPPAGGINSEYANNIDGKSTFWDSGYRQLATRLFIDKVFLPKLTR
jgi:hypothetical protein